MLLALGVTVSRIFLGVHFPIDVLGGMLVGLALWFGVDWGIQNIGPVLVRAGWLAQCAAAATASALILLAQAGVLAALRPIVDPAAWVQNAARINVIAPRDPAEIVGMAGLLLGLGTGLACQQRWAPFRLTGRSANESCAFSSDCPCC